MAKQDAETTLQPDPITATYETTGAALAEPPLSHATVANTVPQGADLADPALYFNRELSEVDFNWRVLYQAMDDRTPLLERVRFVAITMSNLDEFFQKRIDGLKRQEVAGVDKLSPDGLTPTEQLNLIREAARTLYGATSELWEEMLRPMLGEQAGVNLKDFDALPEKEQKAARDYFCSTLYPVLTPLAVDPSRPFPFISNFSLSLAITMRDPAQDNNHFVRLKVPVNRGRWLPLGEALVPLEQVVKHHASELFPGMEVTGVYAFRVTRNADVRRDEEDAEDLLEVISEELRERRFAPAVRLEVEKAMPYAVRRYLLKHLRLGEEDVFEAAQSLALTDCNQLIKAARNGLTYPDWRPVTPARLTYRDDTEEDIFTILRKGDLLVHHPYEQFNASVSRFVEEAAEDEQVIAIKQTLYRTTEDSPAAAALMRAAERGKQVAVLLEVKARFDEANNLEWVQTLERAGVHVTYGLVGLKTHAKVTLVVREDEDGIRTYCHIGTGNYNSNTARLYTDLGLLTCDPIIGDDIVDLFHHLTGYAPAQRYTKLLVAPRDMRDAFLRLIEQEIEHQKKSGSGRIMAKMNGLDDVETIKALYRASQAGVSIDLVVRGACRLRPGLKGYSETIRVISILGRFLEHDRIYYFHNNGTPEVFIGSADWRRRNLSDRVEAVVPVEDPALQQRLISILEAALNDNRSAWDLQSDGRYVQRRPTSGGDVRSLQEMLMAQTLEGSPA